MNDSAGGEPSPFEPVPTRRAIRSIVSDFFKPDAVTTGEALASGTVKKIVNGLDRRERVFGMFLTLLNIYVIFVRSNQLRIDPKPALRAGASQFLVLGLFLSVVLIVGLLVRRRALLGFASVFIGLVFLQYGAPAQFLLSAAYGAYLIIRAQKVQKLQRSTNPQSRASASKRTKALPSAPKVMAPSPSKRYTPPKRSRTSGRR